MVWIRPRKWPSLGLFSEIDAFWLEGLKRLNPSAFFVFASLGCAFCSPVYHTQDFGMECGLLMIVIFVEMSSDRVGSFHFDIIKVFFPPFNKRSSRFANILFVALFASQYIYHVVDAAVDVFWTSVCTACRSACYWSWSFQFLTPFAVGGHTFVATEFSVFFCLNWFQQVGSYRSVYNESPSRLTYVSRKMISSRECSSVNFMVLWNEFMSVMNSWSFVSLYGKMKKISSI